MTTGEKINEYAILTVAGILFAIAVIAIICDDGDKGLIELLF